MVPHLKHIIDAFEGLLLDLRVLVGAQVVVEQGSNAWRHEACLGYMEPLHKGARLQQSSSQQGLAVLLWYAGLRLAALAVRDALWLQSMSLGKVFTAFPDTLLPASFAERCTSPCST